MEAKTFDAKEGTISARLLPLHNRSSVTDRTSCLAIGRLILGSFSAATWQDILAGMR